MTIRLTEMERSSLSERVLGLENWTVKTVKKGTTFKGTPIKLVVLKPKKNFEEGKTVDAVFAALHEEKCVGLNALHVLDGKTRLLSSFAEPEMEIANKGNGIGTCLTAEAIHHAVESKAERVDLGSIENQSWKNSLRFRFNATPTSLYQLSFLKKDDFGGRKYKEFMLRN